MAQSDFTVDGDTAVVTGASRGIGRAIAERLAAHEVNVAICSRDRDSVTGVAEEIATLTGSEVIGIECDVTNWDAVETLVERTSDEFGTIDVLVNNAGASFQAPIEDLSENAWKTIVDTNLHGAFNCARLVGDQMIDGEGGTIINISSVAGRDGAPKMAHYAASKAGLDKLTFTMAYEWAKYGIRVNGVAPGLIATAGLEAQMGIGADDIDTGEVDRQIGTPDEIASVVHFLASPAARYIQGQTIVAEGVPRLAHSRHHDHDEYVRPGAL